MQEHLMNGLYRELTCHELTNRYAAPERISRLVNVDDLEALDELCLQGQQHVQAQRIGSPDVLCSELIRDLTICLGDIMMRYIRADWAMGVQEFDEGEYFEPTWILLLQPDADSWSLAVEHYVTDRFFGRAETSFVAIVESVVMIAKDMPGLYIGGYDTSES